MRVLLFRPPRPSNYMGFQIRIEPLGLEAVAANLPEHEVEIVDLTFKADLKDILRDFSPQAVGVTATGRIPIFMEPPKSLM